MNNIPTFVWSKLAIALFGIIVIGVLYFFADRNGDEAYKKELMVALKMVIAQSLLSTSSSAGKILTSKIPRCIMGPSVESNLRCLREQQLRDYTEEYKIVKGLSLYDHRGYQELQHFTIMMSKFYISYATIFNLNVDKLLVETMLNSNPTQGGNVGKNINSLREILTPVTDFSDFKKGDTRPNHREFTQAILGNSRKWCAFIWFMVVGIVKDNAKIKKFISDNDVSIDNLQLRIKMVQLYLGENIDHIIGTLCDVSNIEDGIPTDACVKGNKGNKDLKCDIFCGGSNTACTLIYKAFSFYKAMGKELNPPLQLSYDEGYSERRYKPEQFKKLTVRSLLPPPSSRELAFWDTISGWNDKSRVPWPNAMNVILTNPGNPLADISISRQDLSVAGTSGHAESILSMAVLFNRYKDPQKLKDLIRGMIVSICPHHHSIREIAQAAYPPPYNVEFKFDDEGPLDIINNLL